MIYNPAPAPAYAWPSGPAQVLGNGRTQQKFISRDGGTYYRITRAEDEKWPDGVRVFWEKAHVEPCDFKVKVKEDRYARRRQG